MSKVFALMRRDFDHVRHNTIALLVCMGLVFMPSFYAWFNIAGGWDPYGNSGQVKVALANSDEGVKGSIVPFEVNVGERVVTSLTGSTKIGYVVTTEDDAIKGVHAGSYYAAVVIPRNFSANLLSVFSNEPEHPALEYYVNEKRNPIASIVTGKASGSVQAMVDAGFTEAVAEVVADLLGEVSALADDDQVLKLASNLGSVLDGTIRSIEGSAGNLNAYVGVIGSVRGVIASSTALFGDSSSSVSAADLLHESADGVRQFDEAAQTAKGAASGAIETASANARDVVTAIDSAFDTANGETDRIVDGLQRVQDAALSRRNELETFLNTLESLNGQIIDLEGGLDVGGADIKVAYTVENDLSDLVSRAGNALEYLDELLGTCDATISDLQSSQVDAQAAREALRELADEAERAFASARQGYEDRLSGSLDGIAGVIDEAAARATGISGSIKAEAERVKGLGEGTASSLQELQDKLGKAANRLDRVARKLERMRGRLAKTAESGNVELVRTILGGDTGSLVSFLSSPAQLDRVALYPVENNGSAMTPYYATMALWVGGTLMGILLYAAVSEAALEETGAKRRHAYFGRLAFFLAIGALQSTILLLGAVYFLGVQCEHPLLFLLSGWLASTVFINIIYALATAFGDAGKAIAVFIMVIQVAGSGGTFPVEMLPKPFQMAYPFLPFVHSENAMRAAMFGTYGSDWQTAVGTLAAFLIPALILGVVLSRPFAPMNEWIEEKMEETKLM